jgi:hypothetical protein
LWNRAQAGLVVESGWGVSIPSPHQPEKRMILLSKFVVMVMNCYRRHHNHQEATKTRERSGDFA